MFQIDLLNSLNESEDPECYNLKDNISSTIHVKNTAFWNKYETPAGENGM